jgi:dGTPase
LARGGSLPDALDSLPRGEPNRKNTPFGHAGEEIMQKLCPGFRHEQQSLRVVERLENDGQGLNLTEEVRDGILRHSKGAGPLMAVPKEQLPSTLEGQVVRFADVVAYVNHDLDDALRAKVLTLDELPAGIEGILGATHSERITRLVLDIAAHTDLEREIAVSMSDRAAQALEGLRSFLYKKVYYNDKVHAEFRKASELIHQLWNHFMEDVDRFYEEYWPAALKDGAAEDDIRDFLAGMTDAFAVNLHERIFTPRRWYVL